MNLQTMIKDLGCLEDQAGALENEIDSFELDESDYEDSYIEMLDCEGTVSAGGLTFSPSRILSELDPIAYSCGLSDYVGTMDLTESEEYQALTDKLEELESDIETLEAEIDELENGE